MRLNIKFKENAKKIKPHFGEVFNISDGGYERGYTEGEREGYTNGYTEGKAEGKAEGIEQGKQAEYDLFWDSVQQNGTRTNYSYGFCGKSWNDETFKPKHIIKPASGGATYMFYLSGVKKPDLSKVDFSKCGSILQLFGDSTVEELGVLNFSGVGKGWGGLNNTFYNCWSLRKIEKIILPSPSTTNQYEIGIGGFHNCSSLEELRFEGTIYVTFQLPHSKKLSKSSLKNIVGCLSDNKTGQTATFTAEAVNNAFETAEGLADGSTSAEWLALIATKPNWTISLV